MRMLAPGMVQGVSDQGSGKAGVTPWGKGSPVFRSKYRSTSTGCADQKDKMGEIPLSNHPPGDAQASTGRADEEKRRQTHYPAANKKDGVSLTHRYGAVFSSFRFGDIFSALNHTSDFRDSRAESISIRLSIMAFFFALAVPGYALVDYFTLTHEHFVAIGVARCILTLVHIAVCAIALRKLSSLGVEILLAVDITAASLFYVASIYILQSGVGEAAPIGYTFMPFMIIVMLGLFPLTLSSSLVIMTLVTGLYIALQIVLDTLVSRESVNMLFLFALFAGIVFWLQSGQLLMLLRLYRESTRDVLTGLINRRVLMKFLDNEIEENMDNGRCFSILMLDLDRFKLINDDYGHFTGDLVLRATARMLENELRLGDIVARFGGEEFVAVLPGLEHGEAVTVAKRLCKACTKLSIAAPDGRDVTFTTSIGVSEYIPGEKIDTTLRRADNALYSAKEQGRNRVVDGPH